MNEFWLGVILTLGALLAVPAFLALVAGLLRVWFLFGSEMVKPRPMAVDDRLKRAHNATILFLSTRTVRLFWIAGMGVYLVQQNNRASVGGESEFADVRGSIIDASERWDKKREH